MSTGPASRDRMLGRIRASLGVTSDDQARQSAVRARLDKHPRNLVPARTKRPAPELLDLFTDMLRSQGADVTRLRAAQDIPETVARYLRDNNLPAQLRAGSDLLLTALPWEKAPSLEVRHGRASGGDAVALSRAAIAAAETGTLFLLSGKDNPTTLNFLPDTHIAVILASDVVGAYETAWDRLRADFGPGALPRTVNLVSGPSRTADIEQTIVMGAHGPRRLHVILVEDETALARPSV